MTHTQEVHSIAPEMRAEIFARLDAIEKGRSVSVFYACESASRSRGFVSSDSDYVCCACPGISVSARSAT